MASLAGSPLLMDHLSVPPPPAIRHRSQQSSSYAHPTFSATNFSASPISLHVAEAVPVSFVGPQIRSSVRIAPFWRLHRLVKVRSQIRYPIVARDDHWGTWTALFTIGAFGLWSEKTKIGSMVSAALVSTLVGLAASNLGIIPSEAPAYSHVLEFLLHLTIPLLLFRANLRRDIQSTGKLLLAFLLGSVATVVGTVVAFSLVSMRFLGEDNWKIAAALMGSYIGGTVNYVAMSEALHASPSAVAAGVAADNVICAIYFMILFALASKLPLSQLQPTVCLFQKNPIPAASCRCHKLLQLWLLLLLSARSEPTL